MDSTILNIEVSGNQLELLEYYMRKKGFKSLEDAYRGAAGRELKLLHPELVEHQQRLKRSPHELLAER